MKAEELKKKVESGIVALFPGVFLQSSEEMQAEQRQWDDEDPCKERDFSACAYWVTTDDGADPDGYDDIEDIIKLIEEHNEEEY